MYSLPVLYSFRRCPYAIRARLAIKQSGIPVELREVELKNKPQEMLMSSAKGTVPVLVLPDSTVIDESYDIMLWALSQHDPDNWLPGSVDMTEETNKLIELNDTDFKKHLDHYKYADRFPGQSMEDYRQKGEVFLQQLESRLNQTEYLLDNHITLLDMAVLPFIRQFALVDKSWFEQSPYVKCQSWLDKGLNSYLFHSVMKKYSPWQPGDSTQQF